VRDGLLHIFQETYRELRPRDPVPELKVDFFAFTSIKNTIRMREGKLLVRLSDLLGHLPVAVLKARYHGAAKPAPKRKRR